MFDIWIFIIGIATGFIVGVSLTVCVMAEDATKKPRKIYYSFEQCASLFKSLVFDGKEYVPREWYDKACHAFFRRD